MGKRCEHVTKGTGTAWKGKAPLHCTRLAAEGLKICTFHYNQEKRKAKKDLSTTKDTP